MVKRRQLVESDEQKNAFRIYYEMSSGRSLTKLADTIGVTRQTISAWAKRWKWEQRLALVEDEVTIEVTRELARPVANSIAHMMNDVEAMLDGAFKAYRMGMSEIKIKSVRDIKDLTECFLKLKAHTDPKYGDTDETRKDAIKDILEDKDAFDTLKCLRDLMDSEKAKNITPPTVEDAVVLETGDEEADWDSFLKSMPEDKREKIDEMMEAAV